MKVVDYKERNKFDAEVISYYDLAPFCKVLTDTTYELSWTGKKVEKLDLNDIQLARGVSLDYRLAWAILFLEKGIDHDVLCDAEVMPFVENNRACIFLDAMYKFLYKNQASGGVKISPDSFIRFPLEWSILDLSQQSVEMENGLCNPSFDIEDFKVEEAENDHSYSTFLKYLYSFEINFSIAEILGAYKNAEINGLFDSRNKIFSAVVMPDFMTEKVFKVKNTLTYLKDPAAAAGGIPLFAVNSFLKHKIGAGPLAIAHALYKLEKIGAIEIKKGVMFGNDKFSFVKGKVIPNVAAAVLDLRGAMKAVQSLRRLDMKIECPQCGKPLSFQDKVVVCCDTKILKNHYSYRFSKFEMFMSMLTGKAWIRDRGQNHFLRMSAGEGAVGWKWIKGDEEDLISFSPWRFK